MFAIETRKHKDPLRVGTIGISPRFILNSMALSIVKTNNSIVSPSDILKVLIDQVYNYPVLSMEERREYINHLKFLSDKISFFESFTNDTPSN